MEFYIVNDFDRPDQRHVAQVVNSKGQLEYIHKELWDWCKKQKHKLQIGEYSPKMEEFGFDIEIGKGKAMFKKVRDSVAKYEDGKPRRWQGSDEFTLTTKPIN